MDMDLNSWANIATITGGGIAALAGFWAVISAFVIGPLKEEIKELREMSGKTADELDETYVRKDVYNSDRQAFVDTLSSIKRDICNSMNTLTSRVDNLFTELVHRDGNNS